MTRAFVLGNGVSRQGIDPARLKSLGQVYGCNALYREFAPDVLVATDTPISTAIQESGYAQDHVFYTRRPLPGSGARSLCQEYRGYSSGPNAVALAAMHGHTVIYMLGFDMGPNINNLFNNLYADTEFYKTSRHPPTFSGNWVKQITQIAKDFPAAKFVRLCGATTARLPQLEEIANLEHLDLAAWLDRINTGEDL